MPRAHQQNCSGSTTKKASTRLRWSPRRVGESVMNSRSAKNATTRTAPWPPCRPDTQPTQNTTGHAQEVCSKPRRRRAGLCCVGLASPAAFAQATAAKTDAWPASSTPTDDEQRTDLLRRR
jgi:hypothetical protein